jgi:hypothetical protein
MRYRRRLIPRVGARVLVSFLAARVAGTVIAVDEDQRGLEVELDDGDRMRFRLIRATGTFRAEDSSRARLLFE